MRPKLLEIEGLQSFRDRQKVDFDSLGETGLFGIFGPTGSGKSTVLDAITFALYGRVKRAGRGTQGIINTNMDTAKVSFTFELLKDGSRKIYRVDRTYQRKKGSDNSCEPKIARLIEVTGDGEIPVCDKASEVSNSIEELIGLSHDDFTRAVVLPQNSFQEFLMLDSSKKRDMLERIFYLEEYGKKLWEKLNWKTAALKSRIDMLSGELMGYADATGEALAEAKNAFETAISEKETAERELKHLELRFNESREVWQLVRELSVIEDREKQQMAHKEEMDEKRLTLEKAIKADGMIEIIRKNREISLKLGDTEKQLKELLDSLPVINGRLAGTRQKYEAIKTEAATEQPKLVEQRTRLSNALAIKSEILVIQSKCRDLLTLTGKLKKVISGKSSISEQEEKELEILEKKQNSLRLGIEALKTPPDYRRQIQEGSKLEMEVVSAGENVIESKRKAESLSSIVLNLDKKLSVLKEHLISSQNALDKLEAGRQKHEDLKPDDRDSIQKYRGELNKLLSVNNIMQFRKDEIDSLNSRIAVLQSNHKMLIHKALKLEEIKAEASEFFEKCRNQFEQKNLEMDRNAAHMLSMNLVEGEPCPVCGSKHHPNPVSRGSDIDFSKLELQIKQAKEQFNNSEKALKEAERAALAAEEQVKAAADQIGPAQYDLDIKISEYDSQKLSLPEKFRNLEPMQLRTELEKLEAVGAEKLGVLEAWEKKLEVYKSEEQKQKNKQAEDRLVEKGIQTELKVTAENRDQAEKILAELNNTLIIKQQRYSRFLQLYEIESAAAELNRIMENDRKTDLLYKESEMIRESLNSKRTLLEQIKEELRILGNNSIKAEVDINSLTEQKIEKEIKLKDMIGDADIENEIKSITGKLEEYIILEKQYMMEFNALEKQYNECITRKSTLENQQDIYSNDCRNEEDRLKSALFEKGFKDIDEVERSILSKEIQKTLVDEINENDNAWTNILAQKGLLVKRLDSRSITDEEWNHTSNAFQQLAAFKEECVSRSEVARNSFNNLKSKHEKWMELNRDYIEVSNKYGLLDQIKKLLKAEYGKDNSFIDYIVEERLAYVAAKASETLGTITGFKYALELDTDAGFIIRDNANGGVHRMVTSLSGGETFLTSLSLALALSEQIQLKGQSPLEFFFLDEGFGTLDTGLLDTVIDSLERLSSKERVIGLISHVPELKGRMARRLIVDPPSMQGAGSCVRIEKA